MIRRVLFASLALAVPIAYTACGGEDPSNLTGSPAGGHDAGAQDTSSQGAVDTGSPGQDASAPDSGGSADAPIGSDGAGGGDSGSGGASKCQGSTYRVCDGFEGAAIDMTVWNQRITNNATVAIDSMHVARGKSALHVHTGVSGMDTAGTNGSLHTMHGFPFPNNQLWGRVFVYMAMQSPDMHTNMVEAVGTLPGDGGASHYRLGVSTAHVLAGNYIPGDYADHSTTTMPLDQWVCIEWHFDGMNDEYHVYLGGNEITDMAITATHQPPWTAPPFAYVSMGLDLYHDLTTIPTLDAWYDEVALDTARIGCDN